MSTSSLARRSLTAAAEARKGITALLGVAAMLAELNLLHGDAQHWATVGTALGTAALTYLAPNGTLILELDKLADTGPGYIDEPPAVPVPPPIDELDAPRSKPDLDPAPVHPMPGAGKHEATP